MIKVYGDKVKKGTCNSEESEQKEFFGWLKECRPELYAMAIHPKQEGKRTFQQIAKERSMGALKAGIVDVFIPCFVPFICEMKIKSGGVVSQKQAEYLELTQKYGAFSCVALGCDGAKKAIIDWELFCHKIKNPLN